MKNRSRTAAAISAAVTALLLGGSATHAADLTWTPDGDGNWDLSSPTWFDPTTSNTSAWSNATGDSAYLGNGTNAYVAGPAHNIALLEDVTVQNLVFGVGTDGRVYGLSDDPSGFSPGGSLTINGNITKTAPNGAISILMFLHSVNLGAGNHVVALRDTPGDTAEMVINSPISGAGGLTLDNGSGSYETWGTLGLNVNNSYTGATSIANGRVVISASNALGATTAGTTISDAGTLSIGGAGLNLPPGGYNLNIAEPITITRNTYTGGNTSDGGAYTRYPAAIISSNGTGTNTFSGPFVVDSTDARVRAQTSTIVIASNVTQGPNVTAGVLTLDGDFAGFITLAGDNTGFASAGGAIRIINGVEVNASSEANLGGPTSKLILNGGTIHATGALASGPFMTNFGAHDLSAAPINTGVDLDAGQTFTVNGLSGIAIGQRGTGTLQFQGTNTFTGTPFFDGGTINFAAGSSTTQKGLRLRSPVVNVAGTLDISGSYASIGVDSNGTNGGPDKAIVNITGNGKLIQNTNDDFNISDNPNTEGTVNVSDNGELTTNWIVFVGKRSGAVGKVNQSGGTINIKRTGNFGFVLGDGRRVNNVYQNPTGYFTLSGGTFTSAGEVYVGEGGDSAVGGNRAHGYWTQTGGTANINNWFVIGREGAVGAFDMSGGVLNHSGGNMSLGDSNAGGEINTIKVHGNAVINNNAGEMWVGQGGSSIAVMDVYENASVTNNNWVAVGRGGGNGTLNIKDNATFIKQGTGDNYLAIGSGGTGVLNQTGGTLKSSGTRLGEASNGTMNLTGGSATFTGEFSLGRQGNVVGTLNVGGTANVTVPAVVYGATGTGTSGGSINLSGTATLTGASFTAGPSSTGARTFKFDGGTLKPSADSTNFMGAKITGIVSTGGAKIDTNGKSVTVNSALTHDAALTGVDGGLTKTGAGTLKLAGINTYTGNTTVTAGTLHAVTPGSLPGYATSGQVSIASGATLAVSAGGAGEWAAPDVATARASATFADGSALGIDTTNASAPFVYDQVLPGAVGLTKLGSGTLNLTAANTYTGPTVLNGTGSVVLGSAAWTPVLSGAGGAVINGGKLVFDYTGTTSPAGTVVPLLKASHDSSNFRDAAQRFRTTNAANAAQGLGYYDDGASTLAVKYTWYGDANLNGKIDGDDFALLDRSIAKGLTPSWVSGDFNYDNVVDSADYLLIDTSFGQQSGGALSPEFLATRQAQFGDAYVSQLIAAVPEPTTLGLVGLGAVAAFGRRRRNA